MNFKSADQQATSRFSANASAPPAPPSEIIERRLAGVKEAARKDGQAVKEAKAVGYTSAGPSSS